MTTKLPAEVITAVNIIAAWLAVDDFSARSGKADAIILAGNAVLSTIDGACRLAQAEGIPLIISGGIGHSTAYLTAALARHSRYRAIETHGQAEAAMLRDVATQCWRLPEEQVWVESASRNTGENARFTRALLEERRFTPRNVVLIQDPLLQRRTDATFRHVWQDAAAVPTFINWPTFVPQLPGEAAWSIDRFLSLLLGEIPRLRDDAQGYGPNGQNYICHVGIPTAVEDAWQYLMRHPSLAAQTGRAGV